MLWNLTKPSMPFKPQPSVPQQTTNPFASKSLMPVAAPAQKLPATAASMNLLGAGSPFSSRYHF